MKLIFVLVSLAFLQTLVVGEEEISASRSTKINAKTTTESMGHAIDPATVKLVTNQQDLSTVYMSPELKAKQNFKFYNNTFLYVTIRDSYLKSDSDQAEQNVLRNYFNEQIKPKLEGMQPKLRKTFDDHIQITVGSLDELRPAVSILKELPEVLAVEYLDRKNVFGKKATIEEMSKFKSKVKKQKAVSEVPDKQDPSE